MATLVNKEPTIDELRAFASNSQLSSNASTRCQAMALPIQRESILGKPTALGFGAFAVTITTLSLTLMEWRGVTTTNILIGNFFFIAGLGMVISAQWELVRGNSFGYTVMSAFGFFYAGFGAVLTPSFGVTAAYGTDTVEYNNAMGLYLTMWAVFTFMLLISSLATNLICIGIFINCEIGFALVAASYFALADGDPATATTLKKTGGVFCFLAGMLGWYTVAHLMCRHPWLFGFPMGDVGRLSARRRRRA